MNPINVVCIKQGTKYDATYVNNLLASVSANLTIPHRLLCLTEDPTDVDYETLPLEGPYTGWWSKLSLFRTEAYGLQGQVLYLDLDTIVLRNIDTLATLDTDFTMLKDFTRPDRYGSGIMLFRAGAHPYIWDNFNEEHQERIGTFGDQEWIWEQVPNGTMEFFPAKWCVSYKLHCDPVPPETAKIVCFHGEPKPHDILSGWVPFMWNSARKQTLAPSQPVMHKPSQTVNWETGAGLETFIGCGQLRYVCPDPNCKYDSYAPQMLFKHWASNHKKTEAPMPTLFDDRGRQIVRNPESSIILT